MSEERRDTAGWTREDLFAEITRLERDVSRIERQRGEEWNRAHAAEKAQRALFLALSLDDKPRRAAIRTAARFLLSLGYRDAEMVRWANE